MTTSMGWGMENPNLIQAEWGGNRGGEAVVGWSYYGFSVSEWNGIEWNGMVCDWD